MPSNLAFALLWYPSRKGQSFGFIFVRTVDRLEYSFRSIARFGDVDLIENKIRLKPTAKRTNRTVFFDDEAAYIFRRWRAIRQGINKNGCTALFLNADGERLNR